MPTTAVAFGGAALLALAGATHAGLLWDNYSSGYRIEVVSSQVDPGFPFESHAADDFELATTASIGHVNWVGTFFNGRPAPIGSFNIEFYLDAGNTPAGGGGPDDPSVAAEAVYNVSATETDNDDGSFSYAADLDIPFTAIAGQRYWISIQADLPFPPQWGWNLSEDLQLTPGQLGFPAVGIDYWTDIGEVAGTKPRDLAFGLSTVPGAGGLGVFAIAALAGRRRHQRSL